MADTKGSSLDTLLGGDTEDGDSVFILDTSDTTQGAGGTLKRISKSELATALSISTSAPLPITKGGTGETSLEAVKTAFGISDGGGSGSGVNGVFQPHGVLCPHSNLKIERTSATAISVTADLLVLENVTFAPLRISSVSETCTITASGVGGLSTGSEAHSTFYYIWAVYNSTSTTLGLIFDPSATAPTLPSGYDYYGLLGGIYNDSSSDLVHYWQRNDDFIVYNSSTITLNQTSRTSVSLTSRGIPDIATKVRGSVSVTAGTGDNVIFYAVDNAFSRLAQPMNPASTSDHGSYIELTMFDDAEFWYQVNSGTTAYLTVNGGSYA